MSKAARRLPSETVSIGLPLADPQHRLEVSLAYERGILREVVFVGRGKIGHGLDALLHDLGVALSRAIQGRDPHTGDPLSEPEPPKPLKPGPKLNNSRWG